MAGAGAKRREERVKLFATALSNLGVATVVTGFISPLLAGRTQPLVTAGAIGWHRVPSGRTSHATFRGAQ